MLFGLKIFIRIIVSPYAKMITPIQCGYTN